MLDTNLEQECTWVWTPWENLASCLAFLVAPVYTSVPWQKLRKWEKRQKIVICTILPDKKKDHFLGAAGHRTHVSPFKTKWALKTPTKFGLIKRKDCLPTQPATEKHHPVLASCVISKLTHFAPWRQIRIPGSHGQPMSWPPRKISISKYPTMLPPPPPPDILWF